jgi:DNA-binding NarL/FixJ family response regulator
MRSELEPEVVRVAVVTADPLVRSAIGASVAFSSELELVDDVAHADVVVWDPGLGEGAARYGEIAALGAPVAVLAPDSEHVSAALAAGARAVLARGIGARALCAALIAIHRGLTVLDDGPRARVAPDASEPGPARDATAAPGEELTARELQVLQLLAAGLSNKAIARELEISEHTAKFHVNGILAKLGASSRTEAVVAAARRALVIL